MSELQYIQALEETLAIAEADYKQMLYSDHPRPIGPEFFKALHKEAETISGIYSLLLDARREMIFESLKKLKM